MDTTPCRPRRELPPGVTKAVEVIDGRRVVTYSGARVLSRANLEMLEAVAGEYEAIQAEYVARFGPLPDDEFD